MIDNWQRDLLAAGRSERTARAYRGNLHTLNLHHPNLLTVTTDDLNDFLARRRATHSDEARKAFRTAFRSFYSWAFRRHLIDHDPAYDLEPIPVRFKPPRVAADADVQLALLTATEHERGMILLGRYACLRLTELTTLHTRDREGDLLRINGKGGKVRMVPANDDLLDALLTLERTQGDGYYFPGRFGGHMHTQSVNKIITRKTGWNPHSLRHAGATAAYLATGDLRAVQLLLGHSSIATTQRYLNLGIDSVRRVAAATVFTEPVHNPHAVPFRRSIAA